MVECLSGYRTRTIKLYQNQPLVTLVWMTFQDVVHPMLRGRQHRIQFDTDPNPDSVSAWWEEIQVGDENTPKEREGVLDVVRRSTDAFSKDSTDISTVKEIHHQIPTGEARPIKERHRPVAPVRQMLEEMKMNGIIRESHSPWATPMVLVRKKDRSLRFCVDYRKLNSVTHHDAYPLLRSR